MAIEDLYMPAWLDGTNLAAVWLDAYIETGSGQLALETVRRDPSYDAIFPGNRREDGSLRYGEADYLGRIEAYGDALLAIDINPDMFYSKFPDLITGLVSPSEFASRVNAVYERVLSSTEEIRNYYATEYGFDMSDQGIIASILDPDIGDAIVTRQIAMSEVGGSAAAKNFQIGTTFVEKLVNYGLDSRDEAQDYFAAAEEIIPAIGVLAKRHADPDDTFDLEEFSNAQLFGDPEQRRRMRRLIAQERASFQGDSALTFAADQRGSLTGLTER